MNELLNLRYKKYTLDNGLEVILYHDASIPLVAVNLWYRVGSANETAGKTGFAHLFEHMMFQGSENIPKEGHFRYVQEAGGSLNGSTSLDRTNYFETLPSNYLELALWLESDRMGFLLPSLTEEKLRNQKDVVMNERRQRYDNQPYGLAWEKLFSGLYPPGHPYHWPTIGWMEDIEKFRLNDVKDFFSNYYTPSNAALVVGGNFEESEAAELIKKYFGDIPPGKQIQDLLPETTPLKENKIIVHEDNVQLSRIYFAWHADKIFGPDDAPLDILSEILSASKNSRLHKSLVFDKQIAQDVSAFQYSAKLSGSFFIIATAKPGVDLDDLKKEIFAELDRLMEKGVTGEELTRSKNGIRSSFIYSLQKIDTVADRLNAYNFYRGEPNSFLFDLERYEKVGAPEVQSTAKKYLTRPYVELRIIPKTNSGQK